MCKECGNCATEHGARTIDDAVDAVLDSPIQYLLPVSFNAWLFDNLDTPSRATIFGKIIWDDINNGCASSKFTAVQWRDHFEEKHLDRAKALTDLLILAYAEYALTFNSK